MIIPETAFEIELYLLYKKRKMKRSIKRKVIPGYGKKGMGWLKDPKRAAYNKVYRKTTFSIFDLFK